MNVERPTAAASEPKPITPRAMQPLLHGGRTQPSARAVADPDMPWTSRRMNTERWSTGNAADEVLARQFDSDYPISRYQPLGP